MYSRENLSYSYLNAKNYTTISLVYFFLTFLISSIFFTLSFVGIFFDLNNFISWIQSYFTTKITNETIHGELFFLSFIPLMLLWLLMLLKSIRLLSNSYKESYINIYQRGLKVSTFWYPLIIRTAILSVLGIILGFIIGIVLLENRNSYKNTVYADEYFLGKFFSLNYSTALFSIFFSASCFFIIF